MRAFRHALMSCIALLAACGQGENEPGPGAVTVGEARALDEAAEMLEERRLSPDELRNVPAVDTATSDTRAGEGAQGDAAR
jgi:hypothetical protein